MKSLARTELLNSTLAQPDIRSAKNQASLAAGLKRFEARIRQKSKRSAS
jgi:hypothetical protein